MPVDYTIFLFDFSSVMDPVPVWSPTAERSSTPSISSSLGPLSRFEVTPFQGKVEAKDLDVRRSTVL